MNKQKLILPIGIILGCIILGSFYYAAQIQKQNSIERQQSLKIQSEERRHNQDVEAENERIQKEIELKNAELDLKNEELELKGESIQTSKEIVVEKNAIESNNAYREECIDEQIKKEKTLDEIATAKNGFTKEQSQNLCRNAGLCDENGYVIDRDIRVQQCIEKKEAIYN